MASTRHPLRLLAVLAALAGLTACGGDSTSPSEPRPCGDLAAGALAPLAWRWFPLPGSVCNDGSPTGIGVEKGTSPNVLVFLDGGGACWDFLTCFQLGIATTGPFGANEFAARVAQRANTVLDRSAPGNPYKDFTFVFVPYCTGDVHSGATEPVYPPGNQRWFHHGRVNVSKALECVAPALEPPPKVVVSGSSAGGFGALLAFKKAKAAWPGARAYLVDDSGPPLGAIPVDRLAAWTASWDIGTVIADVCGIDCATVPPSLAPIVRKLAKDFPNDRFALLSSTQDATIRTFFGGFSSTAPFFAPMAPQTFEASLLELEASTEHDGAPPPGETHAFIVPGTTHPMLDAPGAFTSQGVPLFEWLRRQVDDDPTWDRAVTR